MASPFHYFRKHQKILMAAAAVCCMLIFVVGDALSGRGSGRGGRGGTSPVANWDGGSVNEGQLQALTEHRVLLSRFLQQVYLAGVESTEQPPQLTVPNFIIDPNASLNAVQLSVVDTAVLSDLAEEAGITVDDAVINNYIKEFGNNRVGGDQIRAILADLGRNPAATEDIVYDTLRGLLMAHYYRQNYQDAGRVMMPLDRWEDWRQVNEKISLDAAVLPVDDFLDEVPAPSDEELAAFYEERKDFTNDRLELVGGRALPSPSRGLTIPRKVRLNYLKGSLVEWRDKYRDEITDEAIAEFYEKNKEVLYQAPQQDDDALDESPPADADDATEEGAGEDTEEETAEATNDELSAEPDDEADDAAAVAEETPVEETTAEESPTAEATGDDDAPQEGPGEESPAEEATDQPSPPADDGAEAAGDDAPEGAAQRPISPFRLVGLRQESDDGDATEDEDAAETPSEAADADEQTPQEDPADVEPDAPSAEDATSDGESDVDQAEADADRYSETRYLPLEEVREDIITILATDEAVGKLTEAMEAAYADLSREYNQYGGQLNEAIDKDEPPPEAPVRLTDLQAVADQYGLVFERGALLTQHELATESIIGRARTLEQNGQPVYQLAFARDLYEPFLTNEDPTREWQGDWFLVVKVEDEARRTPPLEEVRQEAVDAWKRDQAAQLALKKAEELAGEAKESTADFKEFFDVRSFDTVTTDMFSVLEFPNGPGQGERPLMASGFGLENVDGEFHEQVFALEDDEIATMLNFDRSAAYIVKISTRGRTKEELRNLFLAEANGWAGMRDMLFLRQRQFTSNLNDQWRQATNLEFDDEWLQRQRQQ